ncbi:hypothetical protein ACG2F4_07230 [Halalkalibaculum sp. DA3122]|uniref:hypothetical protein n=1 Tax=Halalkalibaculum sp. DA3122 TaxID=3373607 RepID=UPI0037551F38
MMKSNSINFLGNNSRNNTKDQISAKEHNQKLKQDLIDKVNARDYDSGNEEIKEKDEDLNTKKFTKQISSKSGGKSTTSALEAWKNRNRTNSGRKPKS